MKKIVCTLMAVLCLFRANADGGMWFLQLMEEQHLVDSLKKAGMQLEVGEVYSGTKLSLRDCVGQFGGGCTAEVISPNGLLLTNNHCGYSFVQQMSTLENNYLVDGYFAKSRAEELPVPGLDFTFVLRVEEVTDKVEAEARKKGVDAYAMQSYRFLKALAEQLLKRSVYKKTKGVEAEIVPFYGGNRFYVFYTQTYTDVRLVANPPLNVAQFGGDGDNWVWPRHNPDFAIFRVYADAEGQPATYAAENVPLHRERFLPISLRGYKEGDFTMIMGFPGRTSRYLSASQLQTVMQAQYEPVVLAGEPLLRLNREMMAESDSLRLAMAMEHMGLQNMVKNFGGALEAVRRNGLLEHKRRVDAALTAYGGLTNQQDVVQVVGRMDSLQHVYADTLHDFALHDMTLGMMEWYMPLSVLQGYVEAVRGGDSPKVDSALVRLRQQYELRVANVDVRKESRRMGVLLPIWERHCKLPANRAEAVERAQMVRAVFERSLFRSRQTFEEFMTSPDTAVLQADPLYLLEMKQPGTFRGAARRYSAQNALLSRTYQRGLHEMSGWSNAPDANFTQRLTYGHVRAYSPRDAVHYDYKTHLAGMFEKESRTDPDYAVNPLLRSLYEARNFGRYANECGEMQTDFLTDNDITGGNSGSPVLNARGEIIGVAFDGNIESLSSDFAYNPRLQRCICVDIRYVLWILDTFGGSSYLLDELDIRE